MEIVDWLKIEKIEDFVRSIGNQQANKYSLK